MDEIRVFYDKTGCTLTVWFDDPSKEEYASEIGDDIIVMKSSDGRALGFEKLNVHFKDPERVSVAFESFAPEIANV